MTRLMLLLSFCIICMAASCQAPQKDFTIELYGLMTEPCVAWIDENGISREACSFEDNYPKGLAGITSNDYKKQRDWEDYLIESCAAWTQSCGATPERDFTVELYLILEDVCIEWLDDSGVRHDACPEDPNYPKGLAGITSSDFAEERNYEDKIISCCAKWKDLSLAESDD